MTRRVLIALGSNLGDRQAHLERATRHLEDQGLRCLERSGVHELLPYGDPGGPSFLNQVLLFATPHDPWRLLDLAKSWERSQGRAPSLRNAPREIDVDLLAFEGVRVTSPRLTLPHPRLGGRSFLLPMLREIPSGAGVMSRVLRPHEAGSCLVP